MNNLSKTNILDYITNLLSESEYYIRFNSTKDKHFFIKYIWQCYEIYTTNLYETNKLVYDDEQLKEYLFVDATEYSFRNQIPQIVFLSKNDFKIHWLIRIGNGNNFKNSSKFNIWGITQTTNTRHFEKIVQPGDILWFVISSNNGQAIAFAEYTCHNERTRTNEELGWEIENNSNNRTIEINYKNLTNIENDNYFTNIKGQNVNIRKYNDKCKINLPQIYKKTKVV
jgi:hypothetical protein